MITINGKWMKRHGACVPAHAQWKKEGRESDPIKLLNRCIEINKPDWGNWLIVKVMSRKQCMRYAIFSAEQVIDLYEKKYLSDGQPRNAIARAKARAKAMAAVMAAVIAPGNVAVARARAEMAAGMATAMAGMAGEDTTAMLEKILQYGIKLLEDENAPSD